MKSLVFLSAILLTVSSFAAGNKLLLDAACKVTCYTGETVTEDSVDGQSLPKIGRVAVVKYVDVMGFTREQLESKEQFTEYVRLCKEELSEKASYAEHSCMYFKH